jgi:Cysteine-rich secretory protein family
VALNANAQVVDTLWVRSQAEEISLITDRGKVSLFFDNHPQGIILLSSENFNQKIFTEINKYRTSNQLHPLSYSIRLDTLGKKVLYWLHYYHVITHYSSIAEMRSTSDLLNAENVFYAPSIYQTQILNANEIMQVWINSPKHNANLLLKDVEVGSTGCLAKLAMENGTISIEAFCVFECDYTQSKRELTMKVDEVNKKLLKRPIKFQRKK